MDTVHVDTRRDTPRAIAAALCAAVGASAGDTAAAVLAYVHDNIDLRDYDNMPLTVGRYADDIAAVLGGAALLPAPVVDFYGLLRDDVASEARENQWLAIEHDTDVYVCGKTGTVYIGLPGTDLRTAWRDGRDSSGILALVNRRAYWENVYGVGVPERWSRYVDMATASGAIGLSVRHDGDKLGWQIDNLDLPARLVLLHGAHAYSVYAVRADLWGAVDDVALSLRDYPAASDDWYSAAEDELISDYLHAAAVDAAVGAGVPSAEHESFASAASGVLVDIGATYGWEIGPDLSVDEWSRALNRDGWRHALTLLAELWARGRASLLSAYASAVWCGAENGDGDYWRESDGDRRVATAWGPRGFANSHPGWASDDAYEKILSGDTDDIDFSC